MREGWVLQDYIRAGLERLHTGTVVGMLTLTEPSTPRTFGEHSEAYGRFMRDLRVLQGCTKLTYLGVREFQKRGAVHTHTVLPGWRFVPIETLRALAVAHGFGARINITTKTVTAAGGAEGVTNLAAYLSKGLGTYLRKNAEASEAEYARAVELLPVGARLVVHSQDWAGGLTLLDMRSARALGPRHVAEQRLARFAACVEHAAAVHALGQAGLLHINPVLSTSLQPTGSEHHPPVP